MASNHYENVNDLKSDAELVKKSSLPPVPPPKAKKPKVSKPATTKNDDPKNDDDMVRSRSKVFTLDHSEKQTVTNPGREDEDEESVFGVETQKTSQQSKKKKNSAKKSGNKKIACVSIALIALLIGFIAISVGAAGLALGWNI